MHKDIENYTRECLKEMLRACTDDQVMMFKRMYHHKDLSVGIDEAVDAIPCDNLNWAYTQVRNTVKENEDGN